MYKVPFRTSAVAYSGSECAAGAESYQMNLGLASSVNQCVGPGNDQKYETEETN